MADPAGEMPVRCNISSNSSVLSKSQSADASSSSLHVEDTDYDIVEPRADALIQSLRAFGYDLPTAVADLIDNSIAAEARNIWIDFHWSGANSTISIRDDGFGMDEKTLIASMRPGSANPLEKRQPKDLGRFGLGLKTASFSQCKRLTVASRLMNGDCSVRCWDLDVVTQSSQWRLLREGSDIFNKALQTLQQMPNGTLVFWEKMDRVTEGMHVDIDTDHNHFLALIDEVKAHIGLVFHRFFRETGALRVFINGNRVQPWDPFLCQEPATQLLNEEAYTLFGSSITVKPYVLPHHSKITSQTFEHAAGRRGWNAMQGFYIYRNRRLLVAGDWLNLGIRKEEHYKLARILLDIPNSMDAQWEIDVKKSRAFPPPVIRANLKHIAEITRRRAAEIYRSRGASLTHTHPAVQPLWQKKLLHGKASYLINRDYPVVQDLLTADTEIAGKVKILLTLIEQTIPAPSIAIDAFEGRHPHPAPLEQVSDKDVASVMRQVFVSLLSSGLSPSEARLRLAALEPFYLYPHLIKVLPD